MKSHIQPIIQLIFCMLLACQAHGQSLDGSHFKPYSNKWKMYAVDQNGKETLLRIWTDYAQLIDMDGKTYVSRIQELYGPDMKLQELWTNLFEKENLKPYRASQFRTSGDFQYFEFNADSVNAVLQTGDSKPAKSAYAMAGPIYDWTLYGILLTGVKFEKGSSTTLPVFMPQAPGAKGQLVVTVEDHEVIHDESGKSHETWRVGTNFGLTFWLSKAAPYVIQLELPAGGSVKNVWRMY